jgi:drug/metabolite transporter (DMT)-like permease
MWAAALAVLPLAILSPGPSAPTPGDWAAVAALGFICTGAAYLLNFRLIADLGPTRALTVTYLIPLFGTIWGVMFLDERLGLGFAIGAPLVVAGTWLAQHACRGP